MNAQGGEITGPLGLWSFPVLSALQSPMHAQGEAAGPLGLWSFPILNSMRSGSGIRVPFSSERHRRR